MEKVFVPTEAQLALNAKCRKDEFIRSLVDKHSECCHVLISDYKSQPDHNKINEQMFAVLPYYTIAHIVKSKDMSSDDWVRMKREDIVDASKVDTVVKTNLIVQSETAPLPASSSEQATPPITSAVVEPLTWGQTAYGYVPAAPQCAIM